MDEQLKDFIKRGQLMVGILIAALVIFLLGQLSFQSRQLDQQNANQVTVSGEGKVYAKPDVALVSLGVTTTAATVTDVTNKNTDQMNAVITVLKNLKIDEKDIQTTNYSLNPVYSNITTVVPLPATPPGVIYNMPNVPVQSSSKLTGYTLEQDVQVKIRDFTKIGDILSQATASGANVVGDLQFTIDNPEQFKEQARADAIKQAKSNAQNLAKESGVSLGKLINVYEGYNNVSPVMYDSAKAMGAGVSQSAPSPIIQPGQQEIDVTINLTYQVK